MDHKDNLICKVCLVESIDVKLEVIAPCASVQTQNCNNPPEYICYNCFKQNEIKIKIESNEGATFSAEEIVVKKEREETQGDVTFADVECNSFCDDVKIEYDPLEDPLQPTDKETYKCDVCNEDFSVLSDFERHQRTHAGRKPFKCNICQKRLSTAEHFKLHLLIHTSTKDKPFNCDRCGKNFSSPEKLKQHQYTHNRYKCDLCLKEFNRPSKLMTHKFSHTGQKPFICEVCGKGFTQSYSLKVHREIHSSTRERHNCKICLKEFHYLSQLKAHEATHTGEKPYKCDICDIDFPEPQDLRRHNRIHYIGGKLLKCNICDKQFNDASVFKLHSQEHITNDFRNNITKKLSQILGP